MYTLFIFLFTAISSVLSIPCRMSHSQIHTAQLISSLLSSLTSNISSGPSAVGRLKYSDCTAMDTSGLGLIAGRSPSFRSSDGTLALFIAEFSRLNNTAALTAFSPWIDSIERLAENSDGSTKSLVGFCRAWKTMAANHQFKVAQNNVVNRIWWMPAMALADKAGSIYALTRAFIYDSIVHIGVDKSERLIAMANSAKGNLLTGTDEKEWLKELIGARRAIFGDKNKAVNRSLWKGTNERCDTFEMLLNSGNMALRGDMQIGGTVLHGGEGDPTTDLCTPQNTQIFI